MSRPFARRPRPATAGAVVAAALASWAPFVRPARAAEPTPIEVFFKFIKDSDPSVRRKAVTSLAEVRGGKAVEALVAAMRDEDAGVRDRAETLLLTGRDRSDEIAAFAAALVPKTPTATRIVVVRALAKCKQAGVASLRAALADREASVRAAAAFELGALREREALPDLHALLVDKTPLVRAEACAAIGTVLGREAEGMACALAHADRDAMPRIAAVTILGDCPSQGALDAVLKCVSDDAWSLRTAAARTLGAFGGDPALARAAVAALVPALEREQRARVRVEIAEALWALTGIDFGPDPARWTSWFRKTGGAFDPPGKRPLRSSRAAGATFGGLADLPLESEHVCFVFDASSSMNDPVRFGATKTKRDDLREAFEQVLDRLPRGSWINLVPFATKPEAMRPGLFEATPAARSATARHLAKTQADGRTNIYDAVEVALADPEADTIVLLTDGAPSAGKRTQRSAIVDGIREMNRYRLARIHTVEIGAANTGARWKGFLREISDATGGHHLAR